MPVKEETVVLHLPVLGPGFYAACALGGALACGATHTLITPLDLIKCNKQANPALFSRSALSALSAVHSGALSSAGFGSGLRALFRGWGPTAVGYSLQGALKFGLYELIKSKSIMRLELEQAAVYRDAVCLAAAASAELVADVALCPLEAVKVRVQTEPTFAKGVMDGLPRLLREGGIRRLYSGFVPLCLRQVPYTMLKFLSFERVASLLYSLHPTPKQRMTAAQQLSVVFTAGYAAGIVCALISQPADVLFTRLVKAAERREQLLPLCRRIVREEGWRGMWRGLGPRIVMIGTLTGLQWLIYGAFRAAVGLSTPGEAVIVISNTETIVE